GYDRFASGSGEDDGSADGIAYGFALGYDFNLDSIVLGIEAEITDSSVSATTTDVLEDVDAFALAAGRDIYAGLRIGVKVSDKAMVFAKGGYTNQRFTLAYTTDDEVEKTGGNSDGWRLGAGIEFDLGQPFARIEYRYSDYGAFADADFDSSRHQAMMTAGLRF
ncbi:MAG: porin family protein, partial [Sphingomonadaceae bacterium]|nr:porin family protein [Sphingomonadaceae bacterium]